MCLCAHICSIAIIYNNQGKFLEALELFSKSLVTKEKVLGGKRTLVADTKYKCARLFFLSIRSLIA